MKNLTGLKKWDLLLLFIIIVAYFLTRFSSLNNFPIFTDEAIYLRWAQIAKNDAAWRFISLTDGKQPLYIWITMLFMKFIKDPVTAGRTVSACAGLVSLLGLFVLGKTIFNKWKIGLLAAFLYLISPFSLVYDRISLMDGLLAALMIWVFIFEIIYVKTLQLDAAMVLGILIGFAALTKTSGFIALDLLPVFLLLFDWKNKYLKKNLLRWLGLSLIIVIISQGMYTILRLSPFYHIIAEKDRTFIYGFREWLSFPFPFQVENLLGNLRGLLDWTVTYLTIPWVLAVIASFFPEKEKLREKLLLFGWFIIPLGGLALFGKILYPRYIFFMALPLLLLVAATLVKISEQKNKFLIVLMGVILIIMPFYLDFYLLTNPVIAKIPQADSNQYYNNTPSGWGVKEAVGFFNHEAQKGPLTVYTEGNFGLMPASLELYLVNNKNITIKGLWPVPQFPDKSIIASARKYPAYILFFQYDPPPGWKLKEIFKVKKGIADRYQTVYRILP